MRKRFITKRRREIFLLKIFIYFILILLFCFLAIKYLFKPIFRINNEKQINEYLGISTNNLIGVIKVANLLNLNLTSPETFLRLSFSEIKKITNVPSDDYTLVNKEVESEPIIYIYNTHQSEDYNPGNLKEYNIIPTVFMASVILQNALNKYNIASIVEEENIKNVLTNNDWSYNQSYYASRLWLEKAKKDYPNVKYFIDIHRDSVSGSVTIDDLNYAKMMFVVGMNHDNYKANEKLMLQLHNDLKNNYDGVMKNPFYGKNSRYNQDYDPGIILVEVGGPNNTIDEVYNSINILADAINKLIGEI